MKNKTSQYMTHEEYQEGMPHDESNQSNIDGHHHNHSHTDHDRSHGSLYEKNAKILLSCLIVTFVFALIEATGGYFTHSIALLSDALHMLTDAAGLLIAYVANNVSRRPATVNLTFGYGKAEAVGALINCTFTMVLTIALFIEVIERFFIPVEVHGGGLFIIASIGFIVNGIMAIMLSHSHDSLNTKSALIHALGDLLASGVAIAAGVIIYFTHVSIVDPILSLIVIAILINSNYKLIKRSTLVLMAGVPDYLDYEEVGSDLKAIDGIVSVHDLHIWYMSANKPALSAHVVAKNPYAWQEALLACQTMLLEKHKISHVTLQHEFDPCPELNFCEIK